MLKIMKKAKIKISNAGAALYSKGKYLVNGEKGEVNWLVVTLVGIILVVVVFVLFKDTLIPLLFGKITSKVNEIQ
ncbi:hypothetical protein GC101_18085 [Paenibacillus sp. LMG 31459]|uniref:Flagellin Flp1-like domain-containing protein n=1 Tax=Paenibacillus phytohabitans TaxID=2654978 RepID=A0ABX1YIC5_9BACL|nr:hypothetical protein [Paenibacillus phytohabitans]NOU80775.1 hypothetical protein [Paenibacillus phytohabitans]